MRARVRELVRRIRAYLLRRTRSEPYHYAPVFPGSVAMDVLSDPDAAVFFGYHDRTPFSRDGKLVLSHRYEGRDLHSANACAPCEVGYFALSEDGANGEFVPAGETRAWSWQQGSMLQWNPAKPSSEIVFNDLLEDTFGTRVFDLRSGRMRTHDCPFYALSSDGTEAVTLNFSRLHRLRPGYGYGNLEDTTARLGAPADDGLAVMNMDTGQTSLLVSLAECADATDAPSGSMHYLNHASFAPDNTSISFFHIWNPPEGRGRRIRLCNLDRATGSSRSMEEDRLVSHYCWLDAERMLVTNRDRDLVWRYSIYSTLDGSRTDLSVPLTRDGHPMSSCGTGLIVTDGTPDDRRDQHLYVMDVAAQRVWQVAAFWAPQAYSGPVRCDLHPRWDTTGHRICVDAVHRGRRAMMILTVDPGAPGVRGA